MTKFVCDKCETQFEGNDCPECGDKKTKKDDENAQNGRIT